jgi:hypothetical protein
MKAAVNKPSRSKINWTALLIQFVALLAIFDVIPAAAEQPILEISALVGPALIQFFRTWHTSP